MPDQPSVTIPGVPETIKRDDLIAMIQSIGLNPHHLIELEIGLHTIHAVVKAKNAEGRDYVDPLLTNEIATHRIVIRVED